MGRDFFISHATADRQWAEWIAVTLEAAGYTTVVQSFDFRPGTDFAHEMQQALRTSGRLIAVLSPDYLASAMAEAEWRSFFAQDPTGELRKLLPVRIAPVTGTGLLQTRVYVDFVGVGPAAARRRLLAAAHPHRPRPTTAAWPGAGPEPDPAVPAHGGRLAGIIDGAIRGDLPPTVGTLTGTLRPPAFYVSYARPSSVPGPPREGAFFAALSRSLSLGTRPDVGQGYIDFPATGTDLWNPGILRAIASSQSLLPLISPRYVRSAFCAREWAAFADRPAYATTGGPAAPGAAIVPVLWSPVDRKTLPSAIRRQPMFAPRHPRTAEAYQAEGLHGLLSRHPRLYAVALDELATAVAGVLDAVRVPAAAPLPGTPPVGYADWTAGE
ncbi:TIR domain-containing protein [Hamadaea tsunoensis]|uniref:TIR domain-containing protein n=1 Tax=Hamadaea tsunoensis TaxID=53368 RepID=UPI0003FCFB1F|nr:TIR domain-containing protein [Hamadaea tsunoensis]